MASKKVVLKSSDGVSIEVDEAVARHSLTIARMLDDGRSAVPLSYVTSETLAKVIEYCKKHVEAAATKSEPVDEELKAWDADFMKIEQPMLFELKTAARFLEIQKLLDLTSKTEADMIEGKTPEEILKFFNIKTDITPEEAVEIGKSMRKTPEQIRETFYIDDFTPEEKAKIRREIPFAFE